MIDPDQQEKHLAPLDIKVKRKTQVLTAVVAIAIIVGFAILAEIIVRVISAMQEAG